jgi:hypothetical protein
LALTQGSSLGPYEILDAMSEILFALVTGGMGEVYSREFLLLLLTWDLSAGIGTPIRYSRPKGMVPSGTIVTLSPIV